MTFADSYKTEVQRAVDSIDTAKVQQAIDWFSEARSSGATIFVCGNGGSASTASHFVCDILKGASFNRPDKFRIIALTDQIAAITAYGNDVGYETIFVEQLKNFARPGDIFMALSGSGNSPNVLHAMEYANQIGCKTIALTGRDGGKLGPMARINLHVAAPHMGRIEEAHLVMCHMICYHFMER